MQTCKQCKSAIPENARACTYCQSEVQQDEEQQRFLMKLRLRVAATQAIPLASIASFPTSSPATFTRLGFLVIVTILIFVNIALASFVHPLTILSLTSYSLNFANVVRGDTPGQTITIINSGTQILEWQATIGPENWATLSVNSGMVNIGKVQAVEVTVNTNQLLPRNTPYSTTLTFNWNGGKRSVGITVIVTQPPLSPSLCVDSARLDFGPMDVGSTQQQSLTIRNCGGQILKWRARVSNPDSIRLNPSQNSNGLTSKQLQKIEVTVDTGPLPANPTPYQESLMFTSNGGDKTMPIIITVVTTPEPTTVSPSPSPPTWSVFPAALRSLDPNSSYCTRSEFNISAVSSWSCTVVLQEDASSQGTINWQAKSDPAGVTFTPSSQQLTPGGQQPVVISGIPCQDSTFTFSGAENETLITLSWNCPLIANAQLDNCQYTEGQGWNCTLTVSAAASNQTDLKWQAVYQPSDGTPFTMYSDTLSSGSENVSVHIPDRTCPTSANIIVSGPGNSFSLPWGCLAPTMTVSPTYINPIVDCSGNNNLTEFTCTDVVKLTESSTSEGYLTWNATSDTGDAQFTPSNNLSPGQTLSVTITAPYRDCNDTFNFYVNGESTPSGTVQWFCNY